MIETEELEFAPRVISPEVTQDDGDIEVTLRPQNLHEYIGQDKVKEKILSYAPEDTFATMDTHAETR